MAKIDALTWMQGQVATEGTMFEFQMRSLVRCVPTYLKWWVRVGTAGQPYPLSTGLHREAAHALVAGGPVVQLEQAAELGRQKRPGVS